LEIVIDLLSVDRTRATSKLMQCRGPYVRQNWWRDIYNDCCENQQ